LAEATATHSAVVRLTLLAAAIAIGGSLGSPNALHAQSQEPTAPRLPELNLGRALERAARIPRLHSLIVSHRGERVLEHYFNGTDAAELANIKSVSKSVISALVGIAIEQGAIEGIDQTLADYFASRLQIEADSTKGAISIEDLLTMQSGLETTSNRNYGAWVSSSDWVEFALAQPLRLPAGVEMEYSTGNTHLLSAILTAATGQSTLDFAREVLSRPLGFELAPWPRDPQGIYFGGNDMEMTPRQMLAFGELYLNGGRAGNRQIVPERWVAASLEPRTESTREPGRYYGYGWWVRRTAGLQTPYAWGFGGQFIVLVPALDLVVVTTADGSPGSARRSQRRHIYELIEDHIVAPAAATLRRQSTSTRDSTG